MIVTLLLPSFGGLVCGNECDQKLSLITVQADEITCPLHIIMR